MTSKTVLIVGGGPAGLTAALELTRRSQAKVMVLEQSRQVGGLSKTVVYNNNRIDIGGHRFFSRSDRVMDWWLDVLPLEKLTAEVRENLTITYQRSSRRLGGTAPGPDPASTDRVMLLRKRVSRIFYGGKYYDYPVALNARTLINLGPLRALKIGLSYLFRRAFPIAEETSLEDFFINRFGKELYETFFKAYTEKVWGVACRSIGADWGRQRIKGLSITKALLHAGKKLVQRGRPAIANETSLIEQFLYPKLGPGQLWEEVARMVVTNGGEVRLGKQVVGVDYDGDRVRAIRVRDVESGMEERLDADHVISTMPIRDLINDMVGPVPEDVRDVARRLEYRDFITVGLLLSRLSIGSNDGTGRSAEDTWLYIQDSSVKMGRLQIFNNWSPYLLDDPSKVWVGLEYFCNEGDDLWQLDDAALRKLAATELVRLGMIEPGDVLDSTVHRELKAYPAYWGSFERFDLVQAFTDAIPNLFLVGRNGMHRYNNQDHSMLTAMEAVEAIVRGTSDKTAIWAVNAEQDYHEVKPMDPSPSGKGLIPAPA